MPKPFSAEFRRDVIAVTRRGEASMAQNARDFGVSEFCLARWLKMADREDGLTSASAGDRGTGGKGESAELRRRDNQQLLGSRPAASASFGRSLGAWVEQGH
jgi:transposase